MVKEGFLKEATFPYLGTGGFRPELGTKLARCGYSQWLCYLPCARAVTRCPQKLLLVLFPRSLLALVASLRSSYTSTRSFCRWDRGPKSRCRHAIRRAAALPGRTIVRLR